MPENIPPGRSETPGQYLRAWGYAHPVLMHLRSMLPALPAEGQAPLAPGLYVDCQRAPWVAVRGEVRVSLARLVAVTPEGRQQLIGQVQVTAAESAVDATTSLRYYLHQPAGVIAREAVDETRWWLDVLDVHYRLGGGAIAAPVGVTA